MASETTNDDDGLPWLSWALTGILSLAGVLVVGLALSATHPRTPPGVAPGGAVKTASSAPAASSAPVAPAPSSSAPAAASAEPQGSQAAPKIEAPPAVQPASPPPQVAVAPAAPPSVEVRPEIKPEPVVPVPAPAPAPKAVPNSTPPDAAKRGAYVRAVAAARAAMARRNLPLAKQSLQQAVANAQSAADQAEVERLQMLEGHLEEFWDGIRNSVAAMQPVDEIALTNSNRVAVIEASRQELAVQMEGRPQRYRIDAIPMNLLSAIAKSSFKPTPGSKMVIGSFLAMDLLGDRTEAGKLWQEAIRGGVNDAKLLLPELNIPRTAGPANR